MLHLADRQLEEPLAHLAERVRVAGREEAVGAFTRLVVLDLLPCERLGDLHADALGSALYLDARLGLVDDMLHYFDRASMAHSLEVRVPFLDHEFVELCSTIPSAYKLHRFSRSKHVLKLAARGHVPDRIVDKPKVGFFNRSVESWLRAQTDGAVSEYLLDPGARVNELVDRRALESLVRTHDHTNGTYLVLSLLMLEIWLSTFLTRAVADVVSA